MESRTRTFLKEKTENLEKATIVIVGVGGTGSTVANVLARLPLKKIILIDGDIVEESNLERQLLYFPEDLNKNKAESSKNKLEKFPTKTIIKSHNEYLTKDNLNLLDEENIDLIIDCTDNFKAREVINSYTKEKQIPWILTGVIENHGQLALIEPNNNKAYALIANKKEKFCTEVGVVNAAVSVIGSLASSLAINYLAKTNNFKGFMRFKLDEMSFEKFGL